MHYKLFIISQFLGAFFGAGIVYVNYAHAIDAFEGTGIRTLKTAGLFSSYAVSYSTIGPRAVMNVSIVGLRTQRFCFL